MYFSNIPCIPHIMLIQRASNWPADPSVLEVFNETFMIFIMIERKQFEGNQLEACIYMFYWNKGKCHVFSEDSFVLITVSISHGHATLIFKIN